MLTEWKIGMCTLVGSRTLLPCQNRRNANSTRGIARGRVTESYRRARAARGEARGGRRARARGAWRPAAGLRVEAGGARKKTAAAGLISSSAPLSRFVARTGEEDEPFIGNNSLVPVRARNRD